MLISTFPAWNLTASAAWGTPITDSATYEKVIAKVRKDENAYIAGRLRLLIYGDSTANVYGVGSTFPSGSGYQTLLDGEIGQKVAFKGAQCWAYAEYCYYKFFGTAQYVNPDAGKTHTGETLNASNLKKVLADARCGSHLRVGNTHSVCFVCENEDKTGFYYLDSIKHSGSYRVYLHYDTYQSFCDTYSSKTIQYLITPNNYPVCKESGDQLAIVNAKIPVNVQKGKGLDVIGTTFVSDSEITSIKFGVYTSSGTAKFTATVTPNARAYRVNKIADDAFFPFSDLAAGSYVYRITATDKSGSEVRCEESFTVSSGSTASITQNYYAYSIDKFESARYYEVKENTDSFPSPEVSTTSTSVTAGTILSADASHTDASGKVWVRANGRWLRESALKLHTHTLSETGRCTKSGCGYDATPAVTSVTAATYVALSSAKAYDRPYETESTAKKTLSALDTVTVTGKVKNVKGESWLLTDAGYVRAEKLDTVKSLSVVNKPTATEYSVGDRLNTAGLLVRAAFTGGTSLDVPTGKLTLSYSFASAGTPTVTVAYGGKTAGFTVTVNPLAGTESWYVNTNVKIRTGPGTSYDSVGTSSAGTTVTVTAFSSDGSYLWGKIGTDRWIALTVLSSGKEYCEYKSGYLYEIRYDLNGGEGSIPPTGKPSVSNVTVTTQTPALDGHTFLGWATTDDAVTAAYHSGDVYAQNASITLYAVWAKKNVIGGSVRFTGSSVYGEKLTADLSKLTPSNADYSVEWLRDGTPISGATAKTYTLTVSDIGHSVSLRAKGCNSFSGTVTSSAVTVTKKSGAACAAPVLVGATATTLTVNAAAGAEYSLDGRVWQSFPVFTGLKPDTAYTVFVRMAETDTSLPGASASAQFTTEKDICVADDETGLMTGIPSDTTASVFLETYSGGASFELTDRDGTPLSPDTLLGTGMLVKLDGKAFAIVIVGDPSGDGVSGSGDLTILARHVGRIIPLEDSAPLSSCDLNGDDAVNSTDLTLLARHVGGIISL